MGFMDILYVASMPILKTLIIGGYGMVLSSRSVDVLTDQCRKNLNTVVFRVFTPALVFSNLAATVTFEDLISWWSMPVNVFFTFFIGSILGKIVVKISNLPEDLKGIVVAICCGGNLGYFPIIVIPALCDEKANPFGEPSKCKLYANAYASFSMALGSIFLWTYAYNILRASSILKETRVDDGLAERIPSSDCMNLGAKCNLLQTTMPISENPSSDKNANATDSFDDKADYSVDEHSTMHFWRKKLQHVIVEIGHAILHQLKQPPTIAVTAGLFVGAISKLKHLFIGESAPLQVVHESVSLLGNGTIPSTILVLGGNLLNGLRSSRVHPTVIALIICVKFFILPIIGVLIVKGALHLGLLPNDPLYHFVLMFQYTLPPAMNIGTMSQLLNKGQQECSVIFFWAYLVASFALTLWSTAFMIMLLH